MRRSHETPTLYHYFGSSRDCWKRLMISHEASQTSTIEPARDYRGDLPLTLGRSQQRASGSPREKTDLLEFLLALFFASAEREGHVAASSFFQLAICRYPGRMFAHGHASHGT